MNRSSFFSFLAVSSCLALVFPISSTSQPTIAECQEPAPQSCAATESPLVLGDGRFRVAAYARDFDGVMFEGRPIELTEDFGAFWFFSPDNIELSLKILDGRTFNDHFWLFYGSLSDVEFVVEAEDTETGSCRRYCNLPNQLASVGDTAAFYSPLPVPSALSLIATPQFVPRDAETTTIELTCRVIDSTGAPLAGVEVRFSSLGTFRAGGRVATNSEGEARESVTITSEDLLGIPDDGSFPVSAHIESVDPSLTASVEIAVL